MFLKNDGSLWTMGYNYEGQLGDGTHNTTNRPIKIVATGVTAIAAGYYHTLFLKSDGSLWAMGDNVYGELGNGTFTSTNQPIKVVSSGVAQIGAGYYYSIFLKTDGSLWGMGSGDDGEFGDGTYLGSGTPKQILASNVVTIPSRIYRSTLFIKGDGSLWGSGYNNYGQLGNGYYNIANPSGTNQLQLIVPPPGYNLVSGQLLNGGNVRLTFLGNAGTNYILDRSFNLVYPNWVTQATNTAGPDGVLIFTNTPTQSTNNFWRIRSMP